jgi:hypothetical protein
MRFIAKHVVVHGRYFNAIRSQRALPDSLRWPTARSLQICGFTLPSRQEVDRRRGAHGWWDFHAAFHDFFHPWDAELQDSTINLARVDSARLHLPWSTESRIYCLPLLDIA